MPPEIKRLGIQIRPATTVSTTTVGEKPAIWRLSEQTVKAIESVERNSREAERTALKRFGR